MFSLRSSSTSTSSGDATTAPAPATSSPKFPIYLLPTFVIPFRSKRRQSSTTTTTTTTTTTSSSYGSPPSRDAVPSLSSTPTSSALSSPVVETPPTPSSLFSSSKTVPDQDDRRGSIEPLDISTTTTTPTTKLTQTQPDTIRCSTCAADFAFCSQIVSKGFTGRYGRAYLVSAPAYPHKNNNNNNKEGHKVGDLVNIKVGKPETRLLVTGSHLVADIACAVCHVKVGWKYVDAKEEAQKYKVGKFILETQRCVDHRSWEDVAAAEAPEVERARRDPLGFTTDDDDDDTKPGAVVFDSDDEDECEDLFSGTWDPAVVAKRRSRKVNQRSTKG